MAVSACSSGGRGSSGNTPNAPKTSTSSGSGTSAATTFGTLASPCGKGSATGATDQGVTNTSIAIGYGDDRGAAQAPGLNQEIGDAVKAMIKWCNDQGGINGRQVVGDFYDAAITNIGPAIQSACAKDFMLVGSGWAADEAAEQTRVGCNLVSTPTYTVGPDYANGPMVYDALPNPVDYQPASGLFQMAQLFPDTKSAFGVMSTNLPAIQATVAKVKISAAAAGFTVVDCGVTMNYTGEPNYTPFAEKFKQCGAKIIYLPTPGAEVNGLLTAMNQLGVHPKYIMQANGYVGSFAQWNTAGYGNDVYVQSAFEPIENASEVPAVQAYVNAVNATGGKLATLGMQATSSFLMWATAAKACGSTLTRQCMVNKLSAVHDWTAGGLNAATDPGANMPTQCGLLLKLDGTKWVQAYPSTAGKFDCNASYVVKLPQSVWGTTLNSDRIATRFLTDKVITPQK
ncbi:MAG: branched-chain amino acid ABC transporter substrate-binding protein [Jatrophihabitans sp.]|nr:MAG: branched-chain amino acid ABC transporter substrate-binding protein [Jatrophihabitans sp.]